GAEPAGAVLVRGADGRPAVPRAGDAGDGGRAVRVGRSDRVAVPDGQHGGRAGAGERPADAHHRPSRPTSAPPPRPLPGADARRRPGRYRASLVRTGGGGRAAGRAAGGVPELRPLPAVHAPGGDGSRGVAVPALEAAAAAGIIRGTPLEWWNGRHASL